MNKDRLRHTELRSILALALCACLLSGCGRKNFRQWSETAPLAYTDSDRHYVELALDAYTARSRMTREEALKAVYPLVVDFPDAVCVAMHHRPGHTDSMTTICFDNKTDELLTYFHSDLKPQFQHIPDKLKRPQYGEVIVSGPGSPTG
jgi:hypothetical protein